MDDNYKSNRKFIEINSPSDNFYNVESCGHYFNKMFSIDNYPIIHHSWTPTQLRNIADKLEKLGENVSVKIEAEGYLTCYQHETVEKYEARILFENEQNLKNKFILENKQKEKRLQEWKKLKKEFENHDE